MWPKQLEPCFYIETCYGCSSHQWNTRHNEEVYDYYSKRLKSYIINYIDYFRTTYDYDVWNKEEYKDTPV